MGQTQEPEPPLSPKLRELVTGVLNGITGDNAEWLDQPLVLPETTQQPPEMGIPSPLTGIISRRSAAETSPHSGYFPVPPGLNMIWKATQRETNSSLVIERSNEGEEKQIILTVNVGDNGQPQFFAPKEPDFQTAVQVLIPPVFRRILKPQGMNQTEFERIMRFMQTNLATILKNINYSQQNKIFEISKQNFQIVSFALSSISSALCALLPREKEPSIREAFSADINSLSESLS